MLAWLKRLFAADDARRNETSQTHQARKLEMDEPMAGAGAQLAATENESETERNLRRSE